MTNVQRAWALPRCPWEQGDYDRLYAFNHGADDYSERESTWQERRIPQGLAEVEVYQRLPSAAKYEFGGYLTKTRLRFHRCEATLAHSPMSKCCTFHSHPTSHELADVPSAEDVF